MGCQPDPSQHQNPQRTRVHVRTQIFPENQTLPHRRDMTQGGSLIDR